MGNLAIEMLLLPQYKSALLEAFYYHSDKSQTVLSYQLVIRYMSVSTGDTIADAAIPSKLILTTWLINFPLHLSDESANLNTSTGLESEEDEGDVSLSSSTLEETLPPPMMVGGGLGALEPAGIVLAGFRDCSEEAIRYLVDVEQMSEDDPLILGLKQHLWDKQQHLDVERILADQVCSSWGSPGGVQDPTHSYGIYPHPAERTAADLPGASSSQSNCSSCTHPTDPHHHHQHQHHSMEEGHSDFSSSHRTLEVPSMVCTTTSPTDTLLPHHMTVINSGSHHTTTTSSFPVPPPHVCSMEASMEEDSNAHLNLALLAQNNPAIASLTQEILSLLGGHDSDLEDSDIDLEEEPTSD